MKKIMSKMLHAGMVFVLAFVAFGPASAGAIETHITTNGGVSGNVNRNNDHANAALNLNLGANTNINKDHEDGDENDGNNEGQNGEENDDRSISSSVSATSGIQNDSRLPSGIQHAKGIEKRIDDGKGLASGLWKFLGNFFPGNHGSSTHATSTASTTADVKAPVVRNLSIVTATSSATLTFTTNEAASVDVRFGTSTTLNASSSVVTNASLVTDHSITLTGLNDNTTYYFTITVKDAAGNVKTSDVHKLHTKAVVTPDVTAPNIIFSVVMNLTNHSARLVWITNELADSKVWVSASSTVDTSVSPTASSASLTYFHSIEVSNLASSTQNFFALKSADASGNVSSSTTGSCTTLAQ